jgi:hypothetical protein
MTQLPVLQLAVALGRLQATPQPPQLVSVSVGVSQPLGRFPSQLAWRPLQTGWQVPALQTLLLVPVSWQTVPQPPQWPASASRSRHAPLQQAPLAHWAFVEQPPPVATRHWPPLQAWPLAQSLSVLQEVRHAPVVVLQR